MKHSMDSLRKAQTDPNRTMAILTLAMTFLVIAFVSALTTGKYPISLADLCAGEPMAVRTFTILRLPRALMGLVGGFGLGVAGFVYQTVFRNPLASPDIIGVSSGASAGAAARRQRGVSARCLRGVSARRRSVCAVPGS